MGILNFKKSKQITWDRETLADGFYFDKEYGYLYDNFDKIVDKGDLPVHNSAAGQSSVIQVTNQNTGSTDGDGLKIEVGPTGEAVINQQEDRALVIKTNNSTRVTIGADGVATFGQIAANSIGTTSGIPVITGTNGVLQNGSFGSAAGTFAAGNHMHGNITNSGAIGSTANLPLRTTDSGVITTGSFGTTAGTFCQGNDARLSDPRTPVAHTHGNIMNNGAIGSTSGVPVITGTSGVLQAGSFGTAAGTFCQGNDVRLSDARTPLAHTHDDRYYTESETDGFLAGKSNTSHNHDGTYAPVEHDTSHDDRFLQLTGGTISGNLTITGNVQRAGVPVAGYLDDGTPYYKKRIQIGDWLMASSPNKAVAHGLTYIGRILNIYVIIISDTSSNVFPLNMFQDNADPKLTAGGVNYIDSTYVNLYCRTGGFFDAVMFNKVSFNRGFIIIEYFL